MTGNCFSDPQRPRSPSVPASSEISFTNALLHLPQTPPYLSPYGSQSPVHQEPGALQHNPHPGGAERPSWLPGRPGPAPALEPSPPLAPSPSIPVSLCSSPGWSLFPPLRQGLQEIPPRGVGLAGFRQSILPSPAQVQGRESIPRRLRGGSRFQALSLLRPAEACSGAEFENCWRNSHQCSEHHHAPRQALAELLLSFSRCGRQRSVLGDGHLPLRFRRRARFFQSFQSSSGLPAASRPRSSSPRMSSVPGSVPRANPSLCSAHAP